MVHRYETSVPPALREAVATALANKGLALLGLGRPEEALTACDEVVRRYETSVSPALRETVVGVLANKAAALRSLGRPRRP